MSRILTSFLGSNLGSDAIYRFSLLLVLVRTVKGFSSMTPVSPSPQRPTIPNSISITSQLFITAISRLLSVNLKRLETLHTFHIRVMIIYRTESSHVRSCFRCTSLEKDETLLSTDYASESPKARWDVLKNNESLFSLSCVMIKAVHVTSLRSHPHHISIWPSERKAFFFSDEFYKVY